jgi:mitosis inhibitor protein kinase SWE1
LRLNTRFSPRTPKDNIIPPDPSSLSISGKTYFPYNKRPSLPPSTLPLPVTPAKDKDSLSSRLKRNASPYIFDIMINDHDGTSLHSRFADAKHIGNGQFSEVYRVTEKTGQAPYEQLFTPSKSSENGFSSSPINSEQYVPKVYAVKKAKNRFLGPMDRHERMQEVQILKELGKHDHVVGYVDHWIDDGHYLCIQTEYCENGSLDKFLEQHGTKGRLDEFRVWKMLLELCLVCDNTYVYISMISVIHTNV